MLPHHIGCVTVNHHVWEHVSTLDVYTAYHSPRSNADAGWQSGERSYSLVREVTHTLAGTPSVDVDSTAHVCV